MRIKNIFAIGGLATLAIVVGSMAVAATSVTHRSMVGYTVRVAQVQAQQTAAPTEATSESSEESPAEETSTEATEEESSLHAQVAMPAESDHYYPIEKLSSQQVMIIQRSLVANGFNIKVDGIFGPKTHQAVTDFQHEKGLPATGKLDQRTLDALGVSL